MLTPYYPPDTSMTSVCPGCPSELAAPTSRQSAWPAATLYVLTASLCKLNVFACVCVCVRARVCASVYSVHGCCDGRWRVSGCGRDHVICLAERGAVSGRAPGSDMCNIVTSEPVCRPPLTCRERSHLTYAGRR